MYFRHFKHVPKQAGYCTVYVSVPVPRESCWLPGQSKQYNIYEGQITERKLCLLKGHHQIKNQNLNGAELFVHMFE